MDADIRRVQDKKRDIRKECLYQIDCSSLIEFKPD